MVINKIKYDNVYEKVTSHFDNLEDEDKMCTICRKNIIEGEEHFREGSIYTVTKRSLPFFPICTNCVKSAEQAEKIIVPLLKIVYGGKLKVVRRRKNDNNNIPKSFYY